MLGSPSCTHDHHCHTKANENQQRVKNCWLRRYSFGWRRLWPGRELDGNLNLRSCAWLETPLRVRFESRTVEFFVPSALKHSRSSNPAGLLIDRNQNNPFPCESLFRPFRSINRFGRVDRLRRLLSRHRSLGLRVHRRNKEKRENENEGQLAYQFSSWNAAGVAHQATHLRIQKPSRNGPRDPRQ